MRDAPAPDGTPAPRPRRACGEDPRELIGRIRAELRHCMRAVSVPDVDWDEADAAVARVQALVSDLRTHTLMRALEGK